MLIPGTSAPALTIETVGHGPYDLGRDVPPGGTLVAFYRGSHCMLCRNELKELDDRIGDFALRGIRLIAISTDTRERAAKVVEEMQLIRLPVGYGLDLHAAREDWGLFISEAREGHDEPALFSEPGHFWIRADGRIAFSVIHSTPFMRPTVNQMLKAMDAKGPPRGGYRGSVPAT